MCSLCVKADFISIEKINNGFRYCTRLNFKSHRRTKTFDSKEQAENWLSLQRSNISEGKLPTQKITLKRAINQWLKTTAGEKMDRAHKTRIMFFANEYKFANKNVCELTPDHFHYLYDLFESKKYTPATGNRYKSAFQPFGNG